MNNESTWVAKWLGPSLLVKPNTLPHTTNLILPYLERGDQLTAEGILYEFDGRY